MSDVEKLREFASQLEWEGSFEGIVDHGHNGSGDDKLDWLLEKFGVALQQLRDRWDLLTMEFDLESQTEDEEDWDGENTEDE